MSTRYLSTLGSEEMYRANLSPKVLNYLYQREILRVSPSLKARQRKGPSTRKKIRRMMLKVLKNLRILTSFDSSTSGAGAVTK
jgi:hypothetical protein